MIIKQPYDFRSLQWIDTKETVNAINRYIVSDYAYSGADQFLHLRPFEGDGQIKPVILYGLTDTEKDVPIFNHPLLNEKNNWMALDLRQCLTLEKETGELRVRNEAEYQMLVQRFILSGMWVTGKQSAVYAFKFPHFVYGDFVSTSLTNKFGLHAGDQIRLKVLAEMYYASQFVEQLTDEDLDKLRVRLKSEVLVEDLLDEVFELRDLMGNLDDFGEACYRVTSNIRLKNLDYNVLVTVFANTWFGLNAKEMVLLALQHPPTWCALVYACLTQRSFRNAGLAKIVEKRDKKDAGKDFLNELVYHTKTYKAD